MVLPVSPSRSTRSRRPSNWRLTPWWTAPSLRMRSPTPDAVSSSVVPCSSTPARISDSNSSRLRASSTTDPIPCRCKRCESRSPAGPPPTIPTRVRTSSPSKSPRTNLTRRRLRGYPGPPRLVRGGPRHRGDEDRPEQPDEGEGVEAPGHGEPGAEEHAAEQGPADGPYAPDPRSPAQRGPPPARRVVPADVGVEQDLRAEDEEPRDEHGEVGERERHLHAEEEQEHRRQPEPAGAGDLRAVAVCHGAGQEQPGHRPEVQHQQEGEGSAEGVAGVAHDRGQPLV